MSPVSSTNLTNEKNANILETLGYTLEENEKILEPTLPSAPKSEADYERQLERLEKQLDQESLYPYEKKAPWIETLCVDTSSLPLAVPSSIQSQDLLRENFFQEIVAKWTQIGLNKVKKLKIPLTRPVDFYAEMLKSDEHMKKIQGNLDKKVKSIRLKENKKRAKMEKIFLKKSGNPKLKAQQELQSKNNLLKDIENWKEKREKQKHQKKNAMQSAESDFDAVFSSNSNSKKPSTMKKTLTRSQKNQKFKKRETSFKKDASRPRSKKATNKSHSTFKTKRFSKKASSASRTKHSSKFKSFQKNKKGSKR